MDIEMLGSGPGECSGVTCWRNSCFEGFWGEGNKSVMLHKYGDAHSQGCSFIRMLILGDAHSQGYSFTGLSEG